MALDVDNNLSCEDMDDMIDTDCQGLPVPTNETRDTIITVWDISPHVSSDYSSCICRSYQRAVQLAKDTVEHLMDDPYQELPVSVTIKQRQMSLGDYEDATDD